LVEGAKDIFTAAISLLCSFDKSALLRYAGIPMEKTPVVFTFDAMIASLRSAMGHFPDKRKGANTQYEIMDAASGAFSVFFTQCPSFLSHQELMEHKYGLSNAQTLFGIKKIPSNNHIRNLLDSANPSLLGPVFADCLTALKRSGTLDMYRVKLGKNKNDLLIALDGTTFCSSDTLHCESCSTKEREGKTQYSHSMVTPTIVAPGNDKVISLMPEFITPQDGDEKQDCEIKASKRLLATNGELYKELEVTFLGDDLYSHEPFCRDILAKQCHFLFVCKPESHKSLYEWIKGITKEKTVDRFDGKKHLLYTYHYVEQVPLKDTVKKATDPLLVNFVEVTITERATGKQVYHNAWITNHALSGATEEETGHILGVLVDSGRARWKIENENNNTLKTKGYNLEHNYGHGKKYLTKVLATMNLIAFLFHTILEYMNEKYQLLRKVIKARKRLFEHIRVLLIYVPCQNFDHFMDFMLEGLKKPHDITKLTYPV
jgi:hypothetical protein